MVKLKAKSLSLPEIDYKVIIAVIALVAGTVGFLILAGYVTGGSTEYIDTKILRSLRNPNNLQLSIGPRWVIDTMNDITVLGSATIVLLITLIVIGYFILQKNYSAVYLILAAVIGGALIDLELKEFFGRVRPTIIPNLMQPFTFSFPSGHSMMSAVIYLSLASLMARFQKRQRDKIYILSVAILLSLIIGVSRVYLGAHYPTDVLGGWLLGTAWAAFCWLIAWFVSQRKISESKL
jgi:undecaprenyl-diphosphatase